MAVMIHDPDIQTEQTESVPSNTVRHVKPFSFLSNPQPEGGRSFTDYLAERGDKQADTDADEYCKYETLAHPSLQALAGDVPD